MVQRSNDFGGIASQPHYPQVRVDPDGKVLRKLGFNPGTEILRRQLTEAPDVEGRILAGKELAETGKRRNIEAIGAQPTRVNPSGAYGWRWPVHWRRLGASTQSRRW